MQNGNAKDPVLLTGALRYNQFLVIWGIAPVPGSGQVSWLKDQRPPPPSRVNTQWPMQKHPGGRLPYHSDEIVRDLRPFPFYPFLCAKRGIKRHLLSYSVLR